MTKLNATQNTNEKEIQKKKYENYANHNFFYYWLGSAYFFITSFFFI